MGAHVTLFTTSPGKAANAHRLGASEVVVSRDAAAMQAATGTLDVILDTVSASHDLEALLGTVRRNGSGGA